MKKVLIALDYSETSELVAQQGYDLAKSMNAQVVLLHVISDPFIYNFSEFMPIMGFAGYADTGLSMLKNEEVLKNISGDFLEHVKSFLNDPSISTYVKEGDFPDEIVEFSKVINADLIVLGSHSHRWFEEILLGSVTEKVLRNSNISLFIVPTKNLSIGKKRNRPPFEIKRVQRQTNP